MVGAQLLHIGTSLLAEHLERRAAECRHRELLVMSFWRMSRLVSALTEVLAFHNRSQRFVALSRLTSHHLCVLRGQVDLRFNSMGE